MYSPPDSWRPWKRKLHEIIFEADTPAGKAFDIVLLLLILATVGAVMLESIESLRAQYKSAFYYFELVVTIVFTIEYVLRILIVHKPWRYVTSFFGVVDLIAILPFYLSIVFAGAQSVAVVRLLRLLRVFRVLKLSHMVREAQQLRIALARSRGKIIVFLGTVVTISVIAGSVMYLAEGAENQRFSTIPKGIYWAVVTMTTVGYGDITPQTPIGQFLASLLMFAGYAIIAVPTGIVSVEIARAEEMTTQSCPSCMAEGHATNAKHCNQCGMRLD